MNKTHPKQVRAELKYLASTGSGAKYIASEGGGDTTEHQGQYNSVPVTIHNGRHKSSSFDLDQEGFALVSHQSQVDDFYVDAEISETYEREVKDLLLQTTGANRVEIFDHTRRSASVEVQKARQIRETASIVHNDYTDKSGPQRLSEIFTERGMEYDSLLKKRFAIINFWRSIRGTVFNSPLAMCDASSTSPEHLVAVTRKSKDRIGELQLATFDESHLWYYFPEMTTGEALLFKTYDSAKDGRARFTIHTSFTDPDVPDDLPPRESIETRCFVFF